jgi:hypothetical protein
MIKKISAADLCYINPNRSLKNSRKDRITMTKVKYGYVFSEQRKLWLFILTYVPEVILTFFYVLWDGGLKEFTLPTRHLYKWTMYESDRMHCENIFKKADEIWEKY